MRELSHLRDDLQWVLDKDPARAAVSGAGKVAAHELAHQLPLVHRSVKDGGPNLARLLQDGLVATGPCTPRESDCGIPPCVYFFLGCAAYPEGSVAFLVSNRILEMGPASFTPFDTGALSNHVRRQGDAPWEDEDKLAFLKQFLALGEHAVVFAGLYLAAHFHNPSDYVSSGQQSQPDFPTHHGLESLSGDRRAWTIEVQLHQDLPLTEANLESVVLENHDLRNDRGAGILAKVEWAGALGLAERVTELILGDLDD